MADKTITIQDVRVYYLASEQTGTPYGIKVYGQRQDGEWIDITDRCTFNREGRQTGDSVLLRPKNGDPVLRWW